MLKLQLYHAKGGVNLETSKKKGMAKVERKTLNQIVYENLKEMILDGRLPPNTNLNETRTSEEMGTSPTPVREAFRMLATEGLVRIEPWKGVVVQEYTADDVMEVFQCRERLECLALELTMDRLRFAADREAQLLRLTDLVQGSLSDEGVTQFVQINSALHDFWIHGSGNRRLMGLMNSMNDMLLHDRNRSAMDQARRMVIIAEHEAILEAMWRMDKPAAVDALRKHIQEGCRFSVKLRGL